MGSNQPDIAVVIPTRLRETRLSFALEALADQTLERARFEVIVVRAGDALEAPLATRPDGLPVRFLTSKAPGTSLQRNLGWRSTNARLVAFTDDDCRPAPDWLEGLLGAADGDAIILQGKTEPDPDERHLLWGFARTMEVTEENSRYPTCNIAYPRTLLERLGGFDESFTIAWGEDTDLALRALNAGATVAFVPQARVVHAVHARTPSQAIRDAWRRDTMPEVFARHREAPRNLEWGCFLRRSHAQLLLGVVGAIAFHRRPKLAALATVPYIIESLDKDNLTPRPLMRQVAHLPAKAAVDAVETASTVRRAIQHRVMVI